MPTRSTVPAWAREAALALLSFSIGGLLVAVIFAVTASPHLAPGEGATPWILLTLIALVGGSIRWALHRELTSGR